MALVDPKKLNHYLAMEKWKLTCFNHRILKSLKNWQCQVFLEEGEDINEKAYLENFSKSHLLHALGDCPIPSLVVDWKFIL